MAQARIKRLERYLDSCEHTGKISDALLDIKTQLGTFNLYPSVDNWAVVEKIQLDSSFEQLETASQASTDIQKRLVLEHELLMQNVYHDLVRATSLSMGDIQDCVHLVKARQDLDDWRPRIQELIQLARRLQSRSVHTVNSWLVLLLEENLKWAQLEDRAHELEIRLKRVVKHTE